MRVTTLVAAFLAATCFTPVLAQDFDACTVFTQEDAEKALGAAAVGETQNPKVKRPKTVMACAYSGFKEGKPVTAKATFKLGKTTGDGQQAFEQARLQHQTKPMLLSGADAFWAGKTGQMHLRKGRAWVTLDVGPTKVSDRDVEDAKKLAEILAKKL